MSDESALLAAILAHPDEDTPRLMFADWLDENGQPERAEFIRIQCNATIDEAAEDRAAELEERNRTKWLAGLGLPQFPGALWGWGRGFPEGLDIRADVLLERYEAFAAAPWPRHLFVYDLHNGTVRDLTSRTWNPRWVTLELQEHPMAGVANYGYDSTPSLVAIANCPQVARLRRLSLALFGMTAAAAAALASSPYLERLEQLHLDSEAGAFSSLRNRFGERLVIG
jgi:uncharacterized protein (TIGR02996 family)